MFGFIEFGGINLKVQMLNLTVIYTKYNNMEIWILSVLEQYFVSKADWMTFQKFIPTVSKFPSSFIIPTRETLALGLCDCSIKREFIPKYFHKPWWKHQFFIINGEGKDLPEKKKRFLLHGTGHHEFCSTFSLNISF